MKTRLNFVWFSLLFLVSAFAWSEDFNGKCVAVTDGDTVQVMHNGKAERIRLDGIDAPESTQAYGTQAKNLLSTLVFGKSVLVQAKEKDKYGRTLATIYDPEKSWNINAMMVRNGYAWHYKEYSKDKQLAECEVIARNAKLGLWKDPNPMPPWIFRKGGYTSMQTTIINGVVTSVTYSNSPPTPTMVYIYDGGKYYHRANCENILSDSKTIALSIAAKSYRPCIKCKPPIQGIPNNTRINEKVSPNLADALKMSDAEKAQRAMQIQQQQAQYNLQQPYLIQQQTTNSQGSDTVYITNTGTKYHRSGCKYLAKSSIPIARSQAVLRYSPCSVCKP